MARHAMRPTSARPFRIFQDVPVLMREALVYGIKTMGNGKLDEVNMTQFMIDRYDVNQTFHIGTLVMRLSRYIEDPIAVQMVQCYVDCHCNMAMAKLAWREDY